MICSYEKNDIAMHASEVVMSLCPSTSSEVEVKLSLTVCIMNIYYYVYISFNRIKYLVLFYILFVSLPLRLAVFEAHGSSLTTHHVPNLR